MSIDELAWNDGLLPVVIQDADTGAVLTLAYANREALQRTLDEKTTWLYSRSRAALWKKGETSGHTQALASVAYDCDADALLYRVRPNGPACHTGATSCFERMLSVENGASAPSGASVPSAASVASVPSVASASSVPSAASVASAATVPNAEKFAPTTRDTTTFEAAIAHLRTTIASRRGAPPESSYTAKLLHDGVDRIGKKIGEEATEVVIAAKNDDPAEIAWEVADLLYHTLVLLEERGVPLDAVGAELLRRAK